MATFDAVRCRPDDADLRMSFAKTLEETGDKEQAGIQYRAAIELKPELEKSQEELEAFEERVEPDEHSPVLRALKSLFNRS